MKKFIKPFIAVCLSAAITAMIFTGCGKSSKYINLEDYFYDSITFVGTDGHGTIDFGKNEENVYNIHGLYNDMVGAQEGAKASANLADGITFIDNIDIEEEGNLGSLKNGDEVEIIVTVVPSKLNAMQGVIKTIKEDETRVTRKYTVSGLEEEKEVNAFDAVAGVYYVDGHIKVDTKADYSVDLAKGKLRGAKPFSVYQGLIIEENEESLPENIPINTDITSADSFQKGMKVNLELGCELDAYTKYGIVFSSKTQEFEVKEAVYPTKPDQISKASLDTIKAYTDEVIKEFTTDSSGVEHEAQFVGMYFEYEKPSDSIFGKEEHGEAKITALYSGIFDGKQQFRALKIFDDILIDENGYIILLSLFNPSLTYLDYDSEKDYLSRYDGYLTEITITKINY